MSFEKLIQRINELQNQILESNLCRKNILSLNEAAKYLGISKSTLYKINLYSGIPFTKPAQKLIYYKREDLDAWMLKNYTDNLSGISKVKPRKRRDQK